MIQQVPHFAPMKRQMCKQTHHEPPPWIILEYFLNEQKKNVQWTHYNSFSTLWQKLFQRCTLYLWHARHFIFLYFHRFFCMYSSVCCASCIFVCFFIYLFHTSFIKCINSLHAEHLIRNKFFVFIFNSAGDASVLLCRFQVSSFFSSFAYFLLCSFSFTL